MNKAKTEISELLKKKAIIQKRTKNSPDEAKYWGNQENVSAFEDRIEFKHKKEFIIMHYSDIAEEYNLQYIYNTVNYSGVVLKDFTIMLDGLENGKKLYDDFIYIQHNQLRDSDKNYNQQLTLFEPIALNYRELKVKPAVSEDQRRFIVLGNSNFQERLYDMAIANFIKAIEVDQTAYPAAYSNLALLSAQLKKYYAATFYMKKYLLLAPEASDARSAQDKIYEWEDKISNN